MPRGTRWVALLVASACASAIEDGNRVGTQQSLPSPPERTAPAEGWRWESSLGIELAVPADWKLNDAGCHQSDAPSIVRGAGIVSFCFTPEPHTKQIVEIFSGSALREEGTGPAKGLTPHSDSIAGEPVQRAEGETTDGRKAGWLHVPRVNVTVIARVLEQQTLRRIFASVRVVDVDHNGCATKRARMWPTPPMAKSFVPASSNALSVCHFDQEDVLQASALIDGPAADELIRLLNLAEPGTNPEPPRRDCGDISEQPADVMLIAQGDRDRALVHVAFSGCVNRGMNNGRTRVKLTEKLMVGMMDPLHTGYSFHPFGLLEVQPSVTPPNL